MKVLVYSSPSCPFCIRAKQFLKDKAIEFTDIDVSSDEEKAEEMVKKSGQMGVPVIDIDGQIVVGFDRPKLSKILGVV
ncbi:Glutaredoxin-like protein, YruB [Candidatus Omnitrophus magneticus]|uniref:Glutaredoxin-like protein, YruB n=1 Tax=Candidatus Omnitrophus magneticus TaxID=1609969 RepID=A0A0F0CTR6_9BACT|nr:Glutaredoxin-like protein, YruB [Candidatus Omnitrophus magneticus]